MSDIIQWQVIFHNASNLPEDRFVNTFTVRQSDNPGDAELLAVAEVFADAYSTDHGTGAVVPAGFLSPVITRATGVQLKAYNLALPEPRVPIYDDFHVLAAEASAIALPEEIALCLSFQGTLPVTPRQRGRIFFGPFNATANNDGEPAADLISQLAGMGAFIKDNLDLVVPDVEWVVHSSFGQDTVVNNGWVDNAFDTQRRRGRRSTTRTTWNA